VALVGERKTTGVAQHVRMNRKAQLGPDTSSVMRAKPAVVKGAPRSLVNTNGDSLILLPLQLAQGPHFIAEGMGGRRALLAPADVQDGVAEIHLIPTPVHRAPPVTPSDL
jgi:hypothetical protein